MGADSGSAGTRRQRAAGLGRAGELVAAEHLARLGYRVVGTGFLARRGEIDLVCSRGGRLVMVEVKTRSSERFGPPSEAVGPRKRRALLAAAAEYRVLAEWRGPIDFAIVSVVVGPDGKLAASEVIENPF